MRHLPIGLCVLSLTMLPAIGLANGPPTPPALRYLRQPDKKSTDDGKATQVKQVKLIENAPVSLTYRLDVTRPKLVIPQKYAVVEGKLEKADAEPGGPRNWFAGLALSAAFVTGGFWLVRRGGKTSSALLIVAIVGGLLSAAFVLPEVFGNGPRPPRITTPLETKDNTANLGMDIVIVAEGERVELLLPKSMLPAIMIPREIFSADVFDLPRPGPPKTDEPAKKGEE